jgi:micrococcal nuclease
MDGALMERTTMIRTIGIAAALLAAPATAAQAAGALTGVPRVIDGGTLAVAGVTIRLEGLDVETLSQPHGPAAHAALRQAVGTGSRVTCRLTGETTPRGEVGRCFNARGLDVAALVVSAGRALDCSRVSNGLYRPLEPSGARSRLAQKPSC